MGVDMRDVYLRWWAGLLYFLSDRFWYMNQWLERRAISAHYRWVKVHCNLED